ncbi:MAG: DUF2752 domain-containing protein [Bradymonadaceae bacterium]
MQIELTDRQPGDVPVGALLAAPLLALPLGAWAVARGWVTLGTCSMKVVTGYPCLTCGATRATMHLLRGELAGAIALQPMIVGLYALLAVWGTASLGAFASGRRLEFRFDETSRTAAKILLVAIPLANWIYLAAAGV